MIIIVIILFSIIIQGWPSLFSLSSSKLSSMLLWFSFYQNSYFYQPTHISILRVSSSLQLLSVINLSINLKSNWIYDTPSVTFPRAYIWLAKPNWKYTRFLHLSVPSKQALMNLIPCRISVAWIVMKQLNWRKLWNSALLYCTLWIFLCLQMAIHQLFPNFVEHYYRLAGLSRLDKSGQGRRVNAAFSCCRKPLNQWQRSFQIKAMLPGLIALSQRQVAVVIRVLTPGRSDHYGWWVGSSFMLCGDLYDSKPMLYRKQGLVTSFFFYY